MRINRIIATIIDMFICLLLTILVFRIYIFIGGNSIIHVYDSLFVNNYWWIFYLVICVVNNTFMESYFNKTIGKMIAQIEVMTNNFTAINIVYILLRNIIKFFVLPIDIVVFIIHSDALALHDIIAGTEVTKS